MLHVAVHIFQPYVAVMVPEQELFILTSFIVLLGVGSTKQVAKNLSAAGMVQLLREVSGQEPGSISRSADPYGQALGSICLD